MSDFKVSACPAGPLRITEPYMYELALVACQVASFRVKICYADGGPWFAPHHRGEYVPSDQAVQLMHKLVNMFKLDCSGKRASAFQIENYPAN
jgi:hypothetical protein